MPSLFAARPGSRPLPASVPSLDVVVALVPCLSASPHLPSSLLSSLARQRLPSPAVVVAGGSRPLPVSVRPRLPCHHCAGSRPLPVSVCPRLPPSSRPLPVSVCPRLPPSSSPALVPFPSASPHLPSSLLSPLARQRPPLPAVVVRRLALVPCPSASPHLPSSSPHQRPRACHYCPPRRPHSRRPSTSIVQRRHNHC